MNFLGPSSHRPDTGTRCVRILIRGCLCLCLYLIFVHLDQFRYLRRAWSGLGFLQRRSRILTFAQHMKLQVQVQGQAPPVLLISSLLLAESPQPCATVGTELASGFATATRTVWQVRWQHRRSSKPHALTQLWIYVRRSTLRWISIKPVARCHADGSSIYIKIYRVARIVNL